MRRACLLACLCLAAALPAAAAAAPTAGSAPSPRAAKTVSRDPNALVQPKFTDVAPRGHRLTADRATAIAERLPTIRLIHHDHPVAYAIAYEKGAGRWQVSYFDPPKGREIAQVLIDDSTARVLEAWTGFKVAWTMARGYPGAFGRKADALYIWLPLSVLFVVPFIDWRRPLRPLHLDLLMLSFFSVSWGLFDRGDIDQSVPLSYPPLLYFLGRMLWIGLRRRAGVPGPLRLAVPVGWLVVGTVFLLGFRAGLNVTNSNVIDVGYSGVIGAHQLATGKPLYGHFPSDNQHGDTYGPVAYEGYLPFERLFGWSGHWDDLPASHGAAIVFDLLCAALLFLVGRRIRGPTLGAALAYAWAAYPFTLLTLATNTNDALVAALILAALLASTAPLRGALAALAGLTKFAPLALAPLFATQQDSRRLRSVALYAVGYGGATALAFTPVLLNGSLHTFWQQTIVYQSDRGAPFSVWGLYGWAQWAQTTVELAGVALALVLALVPRRRDLVGLAALAAAVLIAIQLGVTYWFYMYIVWFAPLVLIALLGRHAEPAT